MSVIAPCSNASSHVHAKPVAITKMLNENYMDFEIECLKIVYLYFPIFAVCYVVLYVTRLFFGRQKTKVNYVLGESAF